MQSHGTSSGQSSNSGTSSGGSGTSTGTTHWPTPQRIVYDPQPQGYTIPVIHHTPLIVFDAESPLDSQVIHVDKRHYEICFLDETESSVEIRISRK